MNKLVASEVFLLSENEEVIINLTIPNILPNIINNILSGRVKNCCNNMYIQNVNVTLTNICNSSNNYITNTNNKGEYIFVNIPEGCYIIRFSIFGFVVFEKKICITNRLTNRCDVLVCI